LLWGQAFGGVVAEAGNKLAVISYNNSTDEVTGGKAYSGGKC